MVGQALARFRRGVALAERAGPCALRLALAVLADRHEVYSCYWANSKSNASHINCNCHTHSHTCTNCVVHVQAHIAMTGQQQALANVRIAPPPLSSSSYPQHRNHARDRTACRKELAIFRYYLAFVRIGGWVRDDYAAAVPHQSHTRLPLRLQSFILIIGLRTVNPLHACARALAVASLQSVPHKSIA